MTDALDLEIRRKIYRIIAKNPGVNLSNIAEMLNTSVQLVDYHTLFMFDKELIIAVREGGFKRYYVKGNIGRLDKKLFGILRQESPLKIVLFLLEHPNSKHKEILDNFDFAGSTLTYHLNKLIERGIICFHDSKTKRGYSIINEKEVIRFLVVNRRSAFLKGFKETWADDFDIP